MLKIGRQAWEDCLLCPHLVTQWLYVIGFGPFEVLTVCAYPTSHLCFANCFLSYFSLQYSRERSSVCQRKCQKTITSICPFGCLDRTILITSKGEDAWDRKSETQLFIVQVVISGSVRTEEKQPADFCLMHLAFIFFITMYKDFLHKETYTVLINSVYGFNWNSSKSEIFVRLFMTRNKCKLFFLIFKNFFEMTDFFSFFFSVHRFVHPWWMVVICSFPLIQFSFHCIYFFPKGEYMSTLNLKPPMFDVMCWCPVFVPSADMEFLFKIHVGARRGTVTFCSCSPSQTGWWQEDSEEISWGHKDGPSPVLPWCLGR